MVVLELTTTVAVSGDHFSPTLVRVVLTGTGRNANDTKETTPTTNTAIEITSLTFKVD